MHPPMASGKPFFCAKASLVTALFGLALSACGKSDAGAASKARPAPLVVVQKVDIQDVPIEVRAPVDLRPLEQADVGSKILGYIDAVLVDRGDKVRKGQLVALVRPSDLPVSPAVIAVFLRGS